MGAGQSRFTSVNELTTLGWGGDVRKLENSSILSVIPAQSFVTTTPSGFARHPSELSYAETSPLRHSKGILLSGIGFRDDKTRPNAFATAKIDGRVLSKYFL